MLPPPGLAEEVDLHWFEATRSLAKTGGDHDSAWRCEPNTPGVTE